MAEKLITKWIREGRLQLVRFPNLTYPCESCGTMIREGRLCANCLGKLQKDLRQMEERKDQNARSRYITYYIQEQEDKNKKN